MRTHRLYTSQNLSAGSGVVLQGKTAHYLSRVLRLAENTEVILFNGDGHDYRCMLHEFARDHVGARVLEQLPNRSVSPLKITLVQAMSRGDRMDYSLQKATELGVFAVQLLHSKRVELKLSGNRLEKRMIHWRGVIQAACEQCERATVPTLYPPITPAEWGGIPGQKLVLDAGTDSNLSQLKLESNVSIGVGPEGGFADSEIELMRQAGIVPVRLGPRILRTETAGPAAIAVMQSLAGDI